MKKTRYIVLILCTALAGAAYVTHYIFEVLESGNLSVDNPRQQRTAQRFSDAIKHATGYAAEGIPGYLRECREFRPRIAPSNCIKIGILEASSAVPKDDASQVEKAIRAEAVRQLQEGALQGSLLISVSWYRPKSDYKGALTMHSVKYYLNEILEKSIYCKEGVCS